MVHLGPAKNPSGNHLRSPGDREGMSLEGAHQAPLLHSLITTFHSECFCLKNSMTEHNMLGNSLIDS